MNNFNKVKQNIWYSHLELSLNLDKVEFKYDTS